MDKTQMTAMLIELSERIAATEQIVKAIPEIFKQLRTIDANMNSVSTKIQKLDDLYGNGAKEEARKYLDNRMANIEKTQHEIVKGLEIMTRREDWHFPPERADDADDGGILGFIVLSWKMFRRRLAFILPWFILGFVLWMLMKINIFGEQITLFGS